MFVPRERPPTKTAIVFTLLNYHEYAQTIRPRKRGIMK